MTDAVIHERNPRRATDERISELKESIRVNGIKQMVTVTRRARMRVGQPEFLYCDFLSVECG
jgi:ParB-like chromosome segregation protein Spo0J